MNIKDIIDLLNKHAKHNTQVECLEFITLDANAIRRYVDIDYKGDKSQLIMRVVYKPELYACDKYLLEGEWRYTRPDELFNSLEI